MENLIGILFILFFICGIVSIFIKDNDFFVCCVGGAGAFLISLIAALIIYQSDDPTAMDVYQGKTTFEYKVVDGVKVDSCVIFKK